MKIEFIEGLPDLSLKINSPKPAKLCIPDFYKSVKSVNTDKLSIDKIVEGTSSVKMCYPFLDGLMSGYIQESWCDIHIDHNEGMVRYLYPHELEIMSSRNSIAFDENIFNHSGFYPIEFIWNRYWIPKLPKGYSILITHPLSRFDLPFYTLSAIVDADDFYHRPIGKIPFYIKSGFEGVIPSGTPMYQIIPFKRDSWEMSKTDFSNEVEKRKYFMQKSFYKNYKKFFRKDKSYE